MTDVHARALPAALANFTAETPLRTGAQRLLNALGYSSQRTAEAGSVEEFVDRFAHDGNLTDRQLKLFESWRKVEIVFQFTAAEIATQSELFDSRKFEDGRIESFLFVAVDMAQDTFTPYPTWRRRPVRSIASLQCL